MKTLISLALFCLGGYLFVLGGFQLYEFSPAFFWATVYFAGSSTALSIAVEIAKS